MSSLPQALQDELSRPFSKDSTIEDEYSLLKNSIADNPELSNQNLVVVLGDYPIFRKFELENRNQDFLTMTERESELSPKPEDDIFVAIAYTNLCEYFQDIDDAREHLNEWAKYTEKRLGKLTNHAPKIKIHVFENPDDKGFNVKDIYNNLYHPDKISYEAGYVDPVTPRVIIECGEHIDYSVNKSDTLLDSPHFHIFYSIAESSKFSNRVQEIRKLLEYIGNGFAVVHDSPPNMEIAAKVLELTCIIASRFTYSDSSRNLVQSLTEGSFFSVKKVTNSKSSSIISSREYRETPIISPGSLQKLTLKWNKYGKSSFFENLEMFDANINEFRYKCNTQIRQNLETFNNKLFLYCKSLILHWIRGRDKNRELDSKIESQIKSYLQIEDSTNVKKWRRAILNNLEVLINYSVQFQPEYVNLRDLLGGKNVPDVPRSEVHLILMTLIGLNEKQYKSYQSISKLYHNKTENLKLMFLEECGVSTNLVDHFDSYRHLKLYLEAIYTIVENLQKNNLGHVSEKICHFYGIQPIGIAGGEEE